jgi:hypothetical protein
MPTIKISIYNKDRLDVILARKIGAEENPAIIMDDVVTEILDRYEKECASK